MKKKNIAVLLIFIFIISTLSASVLQIGPSYTIDMPIDAESDKPVNPENLSFSNYKLGADLRLNIGYLTFEESIRTSFTEQLVLEKFDLLTTLSLKAELFFVDFLIGGGLKTSAVKSGNDWYFNGLSKPDFKDVALSSTLFYKGSLDINLGKNITLFCSLVMPTAESINSLNETREISVISVLTPSLKESQATVGVLFRIF